ncbi:MAG: YicC family protein [Rhodospirillaceae bacterium]|nr:YicC family protein [Rhodospirillaceae bacterium]
MTGFARAEGSMTAPVVMSWAWEARSVNGKSLDLRLRLPPGFDSLDLAVRKLVPETFTRGSISLSLVLTGEPQTLGVRINEDVLDNLIQLAAKKSQNLPAGISGASLDGLMAVRGVIEPIEPQLDSSGLAERDRILLDSLRVALQGLAKARGEEGARLAAIVDGHLAHLTELSAAARAHAMAQPAAIKARFERQVADLSSGNAALTPERLAQEVALLAVKADIREEIDRLKAHLEQARDMMKTGGPSGRRLDFLTQELNREANTLCSKSQDVDLTRIGLDLKATIDQLREQIQNIE